MNSNDKIILEVLKDGKEKSVSEISKFTKKPLQHYYYNLLNLISNKEITKTKYGHYQITKLGKKVIELEEMRNVA